jgi:ribosomal-protein-alanine acetyltransferase
MTLSTPTTAKFRLRPPLSADLAALLALEQQSFTTDRLSRERFQHWFRATNATFLVCADAQDQVAGYALILYRRNSRKARLYSIVVSEEHRGHGLAQQLLKEGEKVAGLRGCLQLYLEVRPDNDAAIKLYEHSGYARAGILNQFYEDGTDALRFAKNLPQNLI